MKNRENRPTLGIDADGVVIDWFGALLEFTNQKLGTNLFLSKFYDYNFAKGFALLDDEMQGIVREFERSVNPLNIPPVRDAEWALEHLRKQFNLVIITSRPDRCREDTKQWFKRYCPVQAIYYAQGAKNPYAGGNSRKTKRQLSEELGILYIIEDNPHEFDDWSSSVLPICFKQPWNEHIIHVPRMDWQEIVAALLKTSI